MAGTVEVDDNWEEGLKESFFFPHSPSSSNALLCFKAYKIKAGPRGLQPRLITLFS